MAVVPWVKKRVDEFKNKDQRAANTKEENELLDLAQERWEIARSEKKDFTGRPLHQKWREFDLIYRGKQWREDVPEGKSTPVLNLTLAMIQAILPRLTDTYPKFIITPRRSPSDKKLADLLTGVQDHLWYINYMQDKKMTELVLHMLKYGTAIIKPTWDPDMYDGLGNVRYNVVHPMNFFPDPRAYEIEDMEYCFTGVPKSLEYILRRWPDKGGLVVPDHDWADVEALQGRDQPSQEKTVTLKEYWFRDAEGQLCVMYYAGNVVLDVIGGELDREGDNRPVYKHNRFPFCKIVDYNGDKEFWGFGEIEVADVLQRLINAFEAQIIDNTRLMGNAQWIVNKVLSGLKEEDAWVFDNQPGRVIYTHNDGVRKEPGVPIPPHIPLHMDRLIDLLEQILGIHDVVQGRRPQGVRAASAIIALQEAANIRVRQKAKHIAVGLREMVEQSNSLVLEYYDKPRQVRLSGAEVPTTLDVRAALATQMLERGMAAGLVELDETGAPLPGEDERMIEELKFPELDVEVKIGPSVPYSQALLYEQAKEFYQIGLIDRRAALEATAFPNREQILKRMEQAELSALQERVGERTF